MTTNYEDFPPGEELLYVVEQWWMRHSCLEVFPSLWPMPREQNLQHCLWTKRGRGVSLFRAGSNDPQLYCRKQGTESRQLETWWRDSRNNKPQEDGEDKLTVCVWLRMMAGRNVKPNESRELARTLNAPLNSYTAPAAESGNLRGSKRVEHNFCPNRCLTSKVHRCLGEP